LCQTSIFFCFKVFKHHSNIVILNVKFLYLFSSSIYITYFSALLNKVDFIIL